MSKGAWVCDGRIRHSVFLRISSFVFRIWEARFMESSLPLSSLIMQKFLSNLLIFFALSLCALCVFQWVRESRLRSEVAELHHSVFLKLDAIQNLETQVKQIKEEVQRLENLRAELSGIIKTNKEEIQNLTKYSEKLERRPRQTRHKSRFTRRRSRRQTRTSNGKTKISKSRTSR